MKSKNLLFFIAAAFFITPIKSFAQVNMQDSLALVDYYDSTYGVAPWQFGQSWDLQAPVSTWLGIGLNNNRVVSIKLWGGGHGGHIPSSFGNLTALERIEFLDYMLDATLPESFENLTNLTSVYFHAVFNMLPFPEALTKAPNLKMIDMEDNYFTGNLPSTMGNMAKLETVILFQNNLSGTLPTGLNSLPSLKSMDISNNKYTFTDIAPFVNDYRISSMTYSLNYAPQGNIAIHWYQDKLAVTAGGNLNDDTFKWFKDSVLVATITSDSTYAPTAPGKYYVEVTNAIATGLPLYADEIQVNNILPVTAKTVSKNITGTDTIYINDGIFKIAGLKPVEGANVLTGNVSTTVTFDPVVSTFNGQPYVQRHYDISPAINAQNAQAVVVLYYTQQDFDNYNSYVTSNNLSYPLLPTGGINNGNVRITQIHGSFAASPDPQNYSGDKVLITPSVSWDNVNKWWILTFYVNGFSGFFVNTGDFVLPLSLVKFKGEALRNEVDLEWVTEHESNVKEFIIERSPDGVGFTGIGTVKAGTSGNNSYVFKDINPLDGIQFYRLKMMDIDGHYTYSNAIKIHFRNDNQSVKIYPNPVSSVLKLKINSNKTENITLRITDVSGRPVYQKIISVSAGSTAHSVNIRNLPAGVYYLNLNVNGKSEKVSLVKE